MNSNVQKLVYTVWGLMATLIIKNALFIGMGAADFPKNTGFFDRPYVNGIVAAWMIVENENQQSKLNEIF